MNKFKPTVVALAVMGSFVFSGVASSGEPIYGDNKGQSSIALGYGSSATDYESIAIGVNSQAQGNRSTSLGGSATSIGMNSIAIGNWTSTRGTGSAVLGPSANAVGDNSLALGAGARVGSYTAASGTEGQAGYVPAKTVNAPNAVAVGASANAKIGTSVALGSSAVADRAAGTFGTKTEALSFNGENKTGSVWISTLGAVSVGSDTASRQITGVAAGSQDNDAVNVAQLRSLKTYTDGKFIDTGNQLTNIETQLSTIETASKENTIFGSGASNLISEAVPDDPDTTDANEAKEAVYAQNAVALGNNAKVQAHGAVAIGANSVASMEGREAAVYLKPEGASGAWTTDENHGLVSFGGSYQREVKDANGVLPGEDGYISTTETVNFNRQLTGVAAGSEDNDAVNVAQLKQLESNTATQLNNLMTGETKVSTIQLTDSSNPDAPTIGLRYEVAKAEPVALADGDPITPTTSQGRLVYDSLDAQGTVIGTETIATLNDGFFVKGGNTAAEAAGVKVDLNKGISFLGDEYLQTSVTAGEDGGAVVTISTSDKLKEFLTNSGVQPSDPTTPDDPNNSGNSGSTGGTWALNGNFANGITVAEGEGNQAIQIKQGNVDMGGNRIQNVGNPINDGDAANKAYVDGTNRSLRNKINDVDKDLRAGVAMAMAVGGLPQTYMPGKSIFGVSAGTYHGQGGFALGLSHATDNRQWVFKGAASVDTRGNFGGQLSAGYQF